MLCSTVTNSKLDLQYFFSFILQESLSLLFKNLKFFFNKLIFIKCFIFLKK